jgi:hypothetical protein
MVGPVFYPFYYPVGFYGGFPGYGFGLGLGFGIGACDPFWGWSFACDGFGYGGNLFYDSPDDLPDLGPDTVSVGADNSSASVGDNGTVSEEGDAVLYLTDGTALLMSNYWVQDGSIHYVTSDGNEYTVEMNEVDVQKTVDANAKRGMVFTLKPSPGSGGDAAKGAAGGSAPSQAAPPAEPRQ